MFTLSDAHEALNGHDEFAVKFYDGKVSFDYIVILPSTFQATTEEIKTRAYLLWEQAGGPVENSDKFWLQAEQDVIRFAKLRRQFRGVTFDVATGEMISLPLHKFFNVNQIAETQYDLIKDRDAVIYEKLDGTMIHFFVHNGKLEAATCRSTQHPLAAEALALSKANRIDSLILESINNGLTPIFEYVAPTNQIVVQYRKPRLVHLISRERKTGRYIFEEKYVDRAKKFEFKFGDVFNNLDHTEFEGYVCHLPDMVVKAKTPWYMERHRAVDALMKPAYKLYQIVFDGFMDDFIAIATEPYKPALREIYDKAQNDLLVEKRKIEEQFAELLALSLSYEEEKEQDSLYELDQEIKSLRYSKVEMIKKFKDLTGLGMLCATKYIDSNCDRSVLPHGLILSDLQAMEIRSAAKKKNFFVELTQKRYPENFSLIMALHQGRDPDELIKERLMEVYRVKYPEKLYAKLEENHEE